MIDTLNLHTHPCLETSSTPAGTQGDTSRASLHFMDSRAADGNEHVELYINRFSFMLGRRHPFQSVGLHCAKIQPILDVIFCLPQPCAQPNIFNRPRSLWLSLNLIVESLALDQCWDVLIVSVAGALGTFRLVHVL